MIVNQKSHKFLDLQSINNQNSDKTVDFTNYEHKKFTKRRRVSLCSVKSEDNDDDDDSQRSNKKFKYSPDYKEMRANKENNNKIKSKRCFEKNIRMKNKQGTTKSETHCIGVTNYEDETPLQQMLKVINETKRRLAFI